MLGSVADAALPAGMNPVPSAAPAGAESPLEKLVNTDELTKKLMQAALTCHYVPIICITFFYLHFRMRTAGEMPSQAEGLMYAATAGVYLQAAACLLIVDLD